MANSENKGREIGGLVMAGLMFIGAGVSWLLKIKIVIGGAIGLGAGLIAMAVIIARYNRKEGRD